MGDNERDLPKGFRDNMLCKITYKNDGASFYTIIRCESSAAHEFKDFINQAVANDWLITDVKFGTELF